MSGPQLRDLVCQDKHTSLPGDIQVAHLWNWRNVTRKKRYMKQFEPCVSSFIFFDLSLRCIHLQYTFKANFLLNYLSIPGWVNMRKCAAKKWGPRGERCPWPTKPSGWCVCVAQGADIMTFWSTCSSHVCQAFPTKGARKLWECTPGAHVTLTANGQFFRCQI